MPATGSKIVLRVDPATARAYENASPEEKERARTVFAFSLRKRQEAAHNLASVMDEMAREARERGLTPEILEEILNEDADSPAVDDDRAKEDA